MYIGSTDTRGLMHCLWEIIDNGVDEALAGAASRIEVVLHAEDPMTGDRQIATKGRLTMVALDAHGRPSKVPPLSD